jgi:hypothetical protein
MTNTCDPFELYAAYKTVTARYKVRQDVEREKMAQQVTDRLLGIVRCRNCNEAMPREDAASWKLGDGWLCDDCIPF